MQEHATRLSDFHAPVDVDDFARYISSIEESARTLQMLAMGDNAVWQKALLRQVTQVKWLLAALVAISLWRWL